MVAAFALLLVAAVFATVLLAVGLVIAAIIAARVFWLLHKAKKRREEEFLRADYRVDPREDGGMSGRIIDASAKRDN